MEIQVASLIWMRYVEEVKDARLFLKDINSHYQGFSRSRCFLLRFIIVDILADVWLYKRNHIKLTGF